MDVLIPEWLFRILRSMELVAFSPCGSRVTCNPPPTDTDADYLVQVYDDMQHVTDAYNTLHDAGFVMEGNHVHYQDAMSTFVSFRKDDINLIVTRDAVWATRHRAATALCTRLNLQDKADRIALFQAVLYAK